MFCQWRDVGVVERAALEMLCTVNRTLGSNPSLSAIFLPFFQSTPRSGKI